MARPTMLGDNTWKVQVELSKWDHDILLRECKKTGASKAEVIRRLIRNNLQQPGETSVARDVEPPIKGWGEPKTK